MAAKAALVGVDPARVLHTEGFELLVWTAVVQRAWSIHVENRTAELQNHADRTGAKVAEVLARALS